jgi:enoyl-CoA hydratase
VTLLLVERSAETGVATITLNRPDVLNALSFALMGELTATFEELGRDDATGAVVLTGAGRGFCAGLDLTELGTPGDGPVEIKTRLMEAIHAFPVPIIAAINGLAVTGGLELALACDILLASSAARFADTHTRVGLIPRWGMTQHLPRLIGYSRARELSFSGAFLDAHTAERWGLVNHVYEPAELLGAAAALATQISANDRRAVRELKRAYVDGDASLAAGYEIERRAGIEFNKTVTRADIAQRREALQRRNRGESGPG